MTLERALRDAGSRWEAKLLESHRAEFRLDERYHYVHWVDEHGIAWARHTGDFLLESAQQVAEMVQKLRQDHGRPLLLVNDIRGVDEVAVPAASFLTGLAKDDVETYGAIALLGGNFVVRTVANLFLRVATVPTRLFDSSDEACRWLLTYRKQEE